jgi:hypothetical protein
MAVNQLAANGALITMQLSAQNSSTVFRLRNLSLVHLGCDNQVKIEMNLRQ